MKKFIFLTMSIFAVALIFVACATSSAGTTGGRDLSGIPDWADKGLPDSFCGVDAMPIAQDASTAFSGSEARARGALAAHVKANVKRWIEDYRGQIQDGEDGNSESDYGQVMTELVNLATEMTQTRDTAYVPSKKNAKYIFKIVCFDVDRYAQAFDRKVDAIKTISDKRKAEIKQNKATLMTNMKNEIAKTEGAKKAEAEYNDAPEGRPEQ